MSSSFILRLARSEDIGRIIEIKEASVKIMHSEGNFQWGADYPTAVHFETDIVEGTLWVVVLLDGNAEEDGAAGAGTTRTITEVVVAFGALTLDQPAEYADAGCDLSKECVVPHRLAVDPLRRGVGAAAALFKKAEDLSFDKGFDGLVRVDTNKVNKAMQGLLTKLGYEFLNEISLAGKPSDMRFVCFEKNKR